MDVTDYCKNMEMEMTTWKAKLYDVTRKVDKLGSAEKEKILANVEDLHMLLEERVAIVIPMNRHRQSIANTKSIKSAAGFRMNLSFHF